ncbi:hypothetical protein QN239_24170 [Mycolicibacterium sp. Y3]
MAAGLTALLVPVAGLVVPLISSDPMVMAQAGATPKPGSAGGNHSKPGDNKKKKKSDNKKKSNNNSNRGGSAARGSGSDSGAQRAGSSFTEQTNANNRWSADGPNRSVNNRISSQAQPSQPAQAPSQVQEAPPTQGQQQATESTSPLQTTTTPDTAPSTQVAPPPSQEQTPTVVLPPQGEYAAGQQTTTTVTPSAPNDPTGPVTALVVGLAATGAGAASSRRNGARTPSIQSTTDPNQGVRGGFSVTHIGQTDGDQTLVTLTDPSSPTRYSFDASQVVPDGGSLRVNPDQTVSILDPSGTATGDGFSAPWARDATGAAQPTQFTAQGTTLTQTITPRPDAVYPITADPDGDTVTPEVLGQALTNPASAPGSSGSAISVESLLEGPQAPAQPAPVPTAQSIQDAIKDLPQGKRANVRVVRDPEQVKQLQDWISKNGTEFQSDPPYRDGRGTEYRLSDGTEVRFGPSGKYGPTVDLALPDGSSIKVHVDAVKGGDIKFLSPPTPPPAEAAETATQAVEAAEAGSATAATPNATVVEPAEAAVPKAPAMEAPVMEAPLMEGGGPGALLGPQLVHLPGSIDHPFPILGVDDLSESILDFEGHG